MILAAGKGERMRPLTDEIPKALVNVAGKTLLEWAVDRYIRAEISNIVIAVGWKGSLIEDFVKTSHLGVKVVHVHDYEIGPLQTLLTALENFEGNFLLSPVDAIIEPASLIGMGAYHSETCGHEGMLLATNSDAESGTLVGIDEDGLVKEIGDVHTKINSVRSAMMFIGNTTIRESCRTAIDDGKERVVQLLEQLVQKGSHVHTYNMQQSILDIDTLSDLLSANEFLLKRGCVSGEGSVYVPSGDRIELGDTLTLKTNIKLEKGTTIIGPVLVLSGCHISENCTLGPNVTIDSNITLSRGCVVSDAVIFGGTKISSQRHIHRSIIYRSIEYDVEV